MSNNNITPAVCVNNVSKVYPSRTDKNVSLRHESGKLLKNWLFERKSYETKDAKGFRALDNVSFDVYPGESLGIIGPNGAGKTTLLRLLANISRPTTGSIQVNGRYTALIGLGGGFHPDLTGRQNIFLNGAINGFGPNKMKSMLDGIINFADIGEFIDSPIREYSSGMKARLGFSIAVKLLPEVIFIDEILSVGDAEFKQKSEEHMYDMLSQNKTIVFVSHALPAIRSLCKRVIWLDHGQIKADGSANEVIDAYQRSVKNKQFTS